MSKVIVCHSDEDFDLSFKVVGNSSNLVVLYFTASWCGPCKMIAPVVDSLATQYPKVHFFKIDVDECSRTTAHHGVRAMPTFHFLRNNEKLDSFSGANPEMLKAFIEKHSASTPFSGEGMRLGGGSTNAAESSNKLVETQYSGAVAPSSPTSIDESFIQNLVDMGFARNRAEKGLFKTGGTSVQAAMDWIFEHMDDADIDEPIVIQQSSDTQPKSSIIELDPEERKLREQAIQKKIEEARKKREQEQKISEQERERNRVIEGQKAMAMKRDWEEQEKLNVVMQAKKEKESDLLAKKKILDQIQRDKLERQAKYGNQGAQQELANQKAAEEKKIKEKEENLKRLAANTEKAHDECQLQVRMPDGSTEKLNFRAEDTLDHVVKQLKAKYPHMHIATLMTNFPKKTYSGHELSKTNLREAELVPRGVLIVPKH